jgi:hypothetical protein
MKSIGGAMKRCFLAVVLIFGVAPTAASAESLLQNGDYVGVIGDSITEQKL